MLGLIWEQLQVLHQLNPGQPGNGPHCPVPTLRWHGVPRSVRGRRALGNSMTFFPTPQKTTVASSTNEVSCCLIWQNCFSANWEHGGGLQRTKGCLCNSSTWSQNGWKSSIWSQNGCRTVKCPHVSLKNRTHTPHCCTPGFLLWCSKVSLHVYCWYPTLLLLRQLRHSRPKETDPCWHPSHRFRIMNGLLCRSPSSSDVIMISEQFPETALTTIHRNPLPW